MGKQRCTGLAWLDTLDRPCSRTGTIRRDGQWRCWQHDPEVVEKRIAKQLAKYHEADRRLREQDRRRSAELLAVGFLSTAALEAGLVKATFSSHDTLADMLRAVQGLDDAAGNDSGELDQLYCDLLPKIKAALAGIPLESALMEAHDDTD
jgi:hypothetical protein